MDKMFSLRIIAVVFSCFVTCSYAANILAVVPPIHSLCRKQAVLGCELSKRGHNITFYISGAAEKEFLGMCLQKCEWPMRNITWNQSHMPITNDLLWSNALRGEGIFSQEMSKVTEDFCIPQISDIGSMNRLKSENFDLALMMGNIPFPCLYVVPYLLNLTYITESTFLLDFPSVRPFLPHLVPCTFSQFSDSMTFKEKFQNIFSFALTYALTMYMMPIAEINKYAPDLSRYDVMRLIEKSTLFLENLDPVAGYPLPTWPNVIQVGGFVTRPAKPLPGDISEFIGKSNNGIILLAFGTILGHFPEKILEKIQASLHSMKYNFIVRAQYNKQDRNILYRTWLPQNNILGHNQTKMFISHCGNNGLYEAIYHGVPMLCFPIAVDQHYSAKRIESLRLGKRMDIRDFTSDTLTKEILSVLENKEYAEQAKTLSLRFHGLPQHPREKAVDWIEYVIKHGGQHLRPRAQDMPHYQYFMLDMIGFALIILHLFIYFTISVLKRFGRCLFKRKLKRE